MRELRRQDRKLSDADARKVLAESEYGFLSTINEDGSPYSIPMAGALVGDTLYFHSGKAGHKLDNLRRDARACYSCVLYAENEPSTLSMNYASCVAEGTVRFVTDEEEREKAMRAIVTKYAPEELDGNTYCRTMKVMPAVVILAMEVTDFQGKANKGKLKEC